MRRVCVECLYEECMCSNYEEEGENREIIPENINAINLLYDEKYLNIYAKILQKYVQRWKSIGLIELSKIMNLNTLTNKINENSIKNDNICKMCLEDTEEETRLGHYLLTFYSLSLPLTNATLVDLFVLWALSRNQPHKISEWINTITPLDVAFHFFFDCCCVDFKPDEYDNHVNKRYQIERSSLLKDVFKLQLNGSINNKKELDRVREELLQSTTNNINTINLSENNICSCNQIKFNLNEEVVKGRSIKTQKTIFSNTNNDANTARKNREIQAIQARASDIIKQRTALNELSVCIIGSNGVIYNNKERNNKSYYNDSKRFEILFPTVKDAENEIIQINEEELEEENEKEEDLPLDNNDYNDISEILINEECEEEEEEEGEKQKKEKEKGPGLVNMFHLLKSPCTLCDKLTMKSNYDKFNNLSDTIISKCKTKYGHTIETLIMLLKQSECETFEKKDVCHHYSNVFCKLNEFRYWQFFSTLTSNAKVQDEQYVKHMINTYVYSKNCTICIDLYITVIIDQINSFKFNSGYVKLKKWKTDKLNKHML